MVQTRNDLFSIGRFARAARLSHKALRLYDRLGLLQPAYIDHESGYRYYRPEQLPVARLIRLLREMEIPLALIQDVLEADAETAEAILVAYEQSFARRLEQVRRVGQQVKQYLSDKEVPMTFQIDVRHLPPQPVLSITERVKADRLDGYITHSLERLRSYAAEQGGEIAAAPFGIYHGAVNQEDDGPVEVCLPLQQSLSSNGAIVGKELEGGRAAIVPISGEACHFPTILQAYDAAFDWITQNGYETVAAPREIWIGPDGDGPMEIAWLFRDKA